MFLIPTALSLYATTRTTRNKAKGAVTMRGNDSHHSDMLHTLVLKPSHLYWLCNRLVLALLFNGTGKRQWNPKQTRYHANRTWLACHAGHTRAMAGYTSRSLEGIATGPGTHRVKRPRNVSKRERCIAFVCLHRTEMDIFYIVSLSSSRSLGYFLRPPCVLFIGANGVRAWLILNNFTFR